MTVISTTVAESGTPLSRARRIALWNSWSSNAVSSTRVVSSNSRVSAARSTCGFSRACAQPAAVVSAPRSPAAAATRPSDGSAARTLSGVGPPANSEASTSDVASSPNAVNTPASTLPPSATAVSRRFARHASRSAAATSAGNCRTIVPRPADISSASWASQ
ncbi:hypothetical protein [Actinomadura madurae]|uniref:hypothetical protein n=1 Tax=Actinomadura madurae TaxID=1993 RepID=UPI0020D24A3A|nr:hypothetical protein [Actinomadura madurae]MCP9981547.1 hypothetical protein [Actinomadura madurae]